MRRAIPALQCTLTVVHFVAIGAALTWLWQHPHAAFPEWTGLALSIAMGVALVPLICGFTLFFAWNLARALLGVVER